MLRMRSVVVGLCSAAAAMSGAAAHAADFYKGKTVTLIVGFSPGGGYDAYARLLSQYLPKYLPGHPSLIVQNMPGAGSQTAVRALDATQAKDGTVLATFNPGLVTQSIVQPKVVKVDFRNLSWVGVATPDYRVCYGYGDKGPKSWADLMKMNPFTLGSTGKGAGNYVNGQTLRFLGAKVHQILGYPGSAEQRIAIEQGALDGDCGSFSSIPPSWIKDHKAHVFVRFTKNRPDYVPESARYIDDFTKNAEQKAVVDFLDASNEVGRPFVMSSKVPPDRLATMRKAFIDAMKDPALIAQAEKQEIPVSPLTGQEAEKIVTEQVSNAPPAIVKQAVAIYE